MASFKNILVLFLALAIGVFAENLNYSCKYTQGLGGPSFSTRAAGTITSAQATNLLNNMFHWSQGRFQATRSRPAGGNTDIITVSCVTPVTTKGQASTQVDDMASIANANM